MVLFQYPCAVGALHSAGIMDSHKNKTNKKKRQFPTAQSCLLFADPRPPRPCVKWEQNDKHTPSILIKHEGLAAEVNPGWENRDAKIIPAEENRTTCWKRSCRRSILLSVDSKKLRGKLHNMKATRMVTWHPRVLLSVESHKPNSSRGQILHDTLAIRW